MFLNVFTNSLFHQQTFGGGRRILFGQLTAFVPSVISSFVTQNKGSGAGPPRYSTSFYNPAYRWFQDDFSIDFVFLS